MGGIGGMRTAWRRAAALATAAVCVACLAGCTGGAAQDDALYTSARQQNLLFRQTVATVLTHLYDGDWQVQEYGDAPVSCGDGYGFELGRTTPEGWTLDGDAQVDAPTLGHRVARWLTDRGWTARDAAADAEGTVEVHASVEGFGIATLTIEIRDGEASADAIGVRATTTCFAGDADELMAVLYPGWPDDPVAHDPLPASEPPGAVPVFGFTEDGHPR
ncbi:hypothetical protein [Microbacterium sp. NPDC058389]|uniref:hypothetical protein n=1 Tax=Microbacterium sp. NPDC058389 TaxID=3346475 RepID=UPI00364FAAD4